ncbi:YceG family protein [Bifidobacterium dolichotidis]|uniref:Endolytic murein transglycosylase n=1 Tax=Bifidobacterium dolichotidis TaxID=2306976 RepID=A0A430FSV8_9BIFI|nr:endolytic transglycosylase MltG [Bifidobacterium dolichotidis]RSX55950.1 YceG family protein [Bifidobacterium dolichotidis]
MTGEDFHDFFEQNTVWEDGQSSSDQSGQPSSALPPEPPRSRRMMRKQRKARKRKRLITVVSCVAVTGLLVGGACFGVTKVSHFFHDRSSSSSLQDFSGPGHGSIQFTVKSGQGADVIAKNLQNEGIIKSAAVFTSLVASNEMTMYPGTFAMKYEMSASEAAKVLSNPQNAGGMVDVRAGERVSEVIANAAKISGLPETDFQKVLNEKGQGILPAEAKGSYEGWLEPGMYDAASTKDAAVLLKKMVDARIARLNELGVPQGEERERILTIASIAEAEVNKPEYYGKVTRVIDNRLEHDMSLGMDTTVAYGLGIKANQLTNDQLNDDSNPYNTRLHKGLPPTPISNPGDNAISAALHPEEGNWLYFVTTNLQTGETKFTDSDAQFQEFVHEYKTTNPGAN